MTKLLLIIFSVTTLNLCADNWTQKASVGTRYLRGAATFTIGNKAYVCGGIDSTNTMTNSLWEYDQLTNVWTQKANYSGGNVGYAATFALFGKGYVGLGENSFFQHQKSWWQYDPTSNLWTQKANFIGGKILSITSVSINNKGYVFSGQDTAGVTNNNIWEYDAPTDTWTQKTSCPCSPRLAEISFSINNKGYFGGGLDTLYNVALDFWEYNASTDSWTQKANAPANYLDYMCFSIGNFGYLVCGQDENNTTLFYSNLWQYNSVLDNWAAKTSFPNVRDEGIAFSIGNYGYAGWGGLDTPLYNDLYQYTPDSTDMIGITEIVDLQIATVYPNPFTTYTTITFASQQQNTFIKITDELGKEIKTINFTGRQLTIDKDEMKAGIYFVQTTDEQKHICNKKIIIQ